MALKIEQAQICPYALPMAIRTARGLMTERRGWHVALRTGGQTGWGDVAPWPGFGADAAAIERSLADLDLQSQPIDDRLLSTLPAPVAHGVEQALLDLLARISGVSFGAMLGLEPAARVAAHRLVADAAQARAAVADGAPALKVKVGADPLDDDDARLARIRAAAPAVPLRLDANGAWDRAAAAEAIARLARHRPAWIEQPLASHDLDGFARLRRESPVPLALDESVALHGEAAIALAEVVVVKPMFVGGLRRARDLARSARAGGATVCITHALESSVGRLGALHLAAGLESHDGHGIHGLAGDGPCAPTGAAIAVPAGPGLGWALARAEAA